MGVYYMRKAAVLLPLFRMQGQLHVLFTERSMNLNSHKGQVCFPGGKLDEHETLYECALREFKEEVGIQQHVTLLGSLKPIQTFTSNFEVHPFVGLLDVNVDHGEDL